jgi:hypothetical protein
MKNLPPASLWTIAGAAVAISVGTISLRATPVGATEGQAESSAEALLQSRLGITISSAAPMSSEPSSKSAQKLISGMLPWAIATKSEILESELPVLSEASEGSCLVAACLGTSISDKESSESEALPEAALQSETLVPLLTTPSTMAQAADGEASGQADLARASQNPIASLISVPFQNNTNFGVGEFDRTSNILNVQPVIPVPLGDSLTLVNRTIVPIAYQPELAPGLDSAFGLGDINYTGFFVPNTTGNFTWGVGPSIVLPTATDTVLGTGKWSAGPAAVGLVSQGPIVAGALVSQLWSFAGDSDRDDVSLLTVQPFFNYNFDGGWYATTSPIITANWQASSDQWTLPIGGGAGRVFNIGSQPVNASLQAYWNVVKPEGAADWTLRAQLTLLFP